MRINVLYLLSLFYTLTATAQITISGSMINKPVATKPSKKLNTGSSMINQFDNPYNTISTIAGSGVQFQDPGSAGKEDGKARAARFDKPFDIISDGKDGFFIADFRNYRIRHMTVDGLVTTYAGSGQGQEDGPLIEAKLYSPVALCLDKNGDLLVADKNWNAIRRITKNGIETIAGGNGMGFDNGDAKTTATFYRPVALAVNSKGDIFVCDEGNHAIRKISGNTVTTYAGNGNGGHADGPAAQADFLYPKSIAVDANDNVYVAEGTMVRKITPDGMVSTVAGREGVQGRRDGKGSAASFSVLTDIIASASGNVYVVDAGGTDALGDSYEDNQRYRNGGAAIRIVSPDGTVQTVAGSYICSNPGVYNGDSGYPLRDGPVSKAYLSWEVFGICFDAKENIYVADAWYNSIRMVSK